MSSQRIYRIAGYVPTAVGHFASELEPAGDEAEVAKAAAVAVSSTRPTSSTPSASASTSSKGNGKVSSIYAPKDPGQGIGKHEVAAILECKKKHPAIGPAQIRAQLKRFKKWRLSNKAIARVLKQQGYELVRRGSRPDGPEPIRRVGRQDVGDHHIRVLFAISPHSVRLCSWATSPRVGRLPTEDSLHSRPPGARW